MKKIVDFEICDIVPYSNGIIFAKKEMLDDNRCKVTFYGYDIKRAKPIPVTKSVYQLNKFGNAFKAICDNIGDYISCDTAVMRNKDIAVAKPEFLIRTATVNGAGIYFIMTPLFKASLPTDL